VGCGLYSAEKKRILCLTHFRLTIKTDAVPLTYYLTHFILSQLRVNFTAIVLLKNLKQNNAIETKVKLYTLHSLLSIYSQEN